MVVWCSGVSVSGQTSRPQPNLPHLTCDFSAPAGRQAPPAWGVSTPSPPHSRCLGRGTYSLWGGGGGDVTSTLLLLLLTHSNIFLVYRDTYVGRPPTYWVRAAGDPPALMRCSGLPPVSAETSLESVSATGSVLLEKWLTD
jgi:hypothetical protein